MLGRGKEAIPQAQLALPHLRKHGKRPLHILAWLTVGSLMAATVRSPIAKDRERRIPNLPIHDPAAHTGAPQRRMNTVDLAVGTP